MDSLRAGNSNPERGRPTFDGEIKSYREYCIQWTEDKQNQAGLSRLGGPMGHVWTTVETRLSNAKEILSDFSARSRLVEQRVRENDDLIPTIIERGLRLRHSGLKEQGRAVVLSHADRNITCDDTVESMYLVIGRDPVDETTRSSRDYYEYRDDCNAYRMDEPLEDGDADLYNTTDERRKCDEIYSTYRDAGCRSPDHRLTLVFPSIPVSTDGRDSIPVAVSSNAGNFSAAPRKSEPKVARPGYDREGHWARNRPQDAPSSGPGSQAKRPCEDMTMMIEIETDDPTEETQLEQKASHSILDGGAVSFLVGEIVFDKYVEQIKERGCTEAVRVLLCEKHFRFGNDKTETACKYAVLPVAFGGKSGYIAVYIISGATPFLFPRPHGAPTSKHRLRREGCSMARRRVDTGASRTTRSLLPGHRRGHLPTLHLPRLLLLPRRD